MAYIIPQEQVRRLLSGITNARAQKLPRYLVLSEEEASLYRLESLERWLTRHEKGRNLPFGADPTGKQA